MIVYETIGCAIAAEQWCAQGNPYGFAVSTFPTAEERLAEARERWPDLSLDETYVISVELAKRLGHI